jgi:hypothetical protein
MYGLQLKVREQKYSAHTETRELEILIREIGLVLEFHIEAFA